MRRFGIKIIVMLLAASCTKGTKNGSEIISIDLESNKDKMEVVQLSKFTDNIQYVPIQSKGCELFTYIYDAAITDNFILIHGSRTLMLYDTSGKFIRNIGKIGRGPGEYQLAFIVGIAKNEKIYLQQLGDLYEYSIDGTFIKKYNGLLNIDNKYYMDQIFLIDDSLFLGYVPNSTGQADYNAFLINKSGEIKHRYKNYNKFNSKGSSMKFSTFDACFRIYNKEYYYKEVFNDTLFTLNSTYDLTPKFVLSLGKYKLPNSERFNEKINMLDYFFINAVYQTDDYLFIDCSFGNQIPAKRLTPFRPIARGNEVWYNTTSVFGIYNKISKDMVFSKPTSTDNFLFTTGIYNDIDAGPRFMPNKMVNDSTMVMWMPANELKAHVASDDFKKGISKYPEKKRKLEELAESLTDYDNPVLMFVTFK